MMADVVKIVRQPTRVVKTTERRSQVIEVVKRGEEGERGPAGATSATFTQSFSTEVPVWTIEHNLGYIPSVTTYDLQGHGITGRIESNSETTTVVSWYYPQAGSASLS